MFRFLVSAAFASAMLVFGPAANAASPRETGAWWAAATDAFGAASGWIAARTVIRIEELDGSGAVTSWERGETRLDLSGPEPRVVVVAAEKNGKDSSDDWRRRYGKAGRGGSPSGGSPRGGPPPGFDATPFDPRYSKALSRGEARASGDAVEVPYAIATDGGPVEGTARFSASGAVIGADQAWLRPPAFVSFMRSSLTYAYRDGALLIAGMSIEGEASILFVKRRFRMSFEFSEWSRRAP